MKIIEEKNLVKVATMYYEEEMTQAEIAKKLGVSRSLISKYLNDAKKNGIIEVFINSKSLYTTKLERSLEKKYDLQNAIVVDTFDLNTYDVSRNVNRIAASFLQKYIYENDIYNIGISWGKTLRGIVDNFDFTNLPKRTVTSLIGGMGDDYVSIHSNQIAFDFARKIRGKAKYLYSPAIIDNEQIKNELYRNEIIQQVLEAGKNVDLGIFGMASPYDENSTMLEIGYIKEDNIKEFKNKDVIGDINSRFFDENGNEVNCYINNSVMGLNLNEIKNIPNVLSVVYGKNKAPVLKVALDNSIINILVTSDQIANYLLEDS